MSEPKKLRVYWFPQIPCAAFYVPVRTVREARLILTTLADYDAFQFKNRIKPDYSNAGGLEEFDPTDTTHGPDGSWLEWYNEDDEGIDELTDAEIDAVDAAVARAEGSDA